MGEGMKLECPVCGYEESICLGYGMLFPQTYRENVDIMPSPCAVLQSFAPNSALSAGPFMLYLQEPESEHTSDKEKQRI